MIFNVQPATADRLIKQMKNDNSRDQQDNGEQTVMNQVDVALVFCKDKTLTV